METTGDGKTDEGQSLEIEKVAGALVAAQGEMTNPPKTKTVYAGQKKYSFAPLPEIIDAVRPVLTKHGLAVVQLVRERMLETRLIHASGQWIGAAYALPNLADSQDMGSAITYARRYSLCAILGIAGEDDEDGEAATEAERAEADAKRKEAEKRLDALKGKGQVKSAYDGKVLAPGEATLPGERTGKVETTDGRPQTADREAGGKRQEESVGRGAPSAEREETTDRAGGGEGGKRQAGGGGGQNPGVRSQKTEGKTAAGPADRPSKDRGKTAHSAGLHQEKGKAPSPPPSPLKGEGVDALAGIATELAALMKKEGITAEALKAYYVGKGHLPDSVEPTELPANYISGLIKPENWEKAVAAIKGGK